MTVLDLFAGPGGFDVAARALGFDVLGVEWDDAACATREAAGLPTIQADVAGMTPTDFDPPDGLVASSPCPPWSRTGNGAGRRDAGHVVTCMRELMRGKDRRRAHAEACDDARSLLAVEPLRWALALKPHWIVLEQVPPAVALWHVYADALREVGYSTWTGVLEAERFGVPQTRERAILIASREGPAAPPPPTHQRFIKGEHAQAELTLEGWVSGWVSIAKALEIEPDPTLILREAWLWKSGRRTADRAVTEPAHTITAGPAGRQLIWAERGQRNGLDGARRATPAEVGVLQTFPKAYPWSGAMGIQFQQIGNAIPPLLAQRVLEAVSGCGA